jgi:hypothetical protein
MNRPTFYRGLESADHCKLWKAACTDWSELATDSDVDFDLLRSQDRTSKFTKNPVDIQTGEHYTATQLLESAICGITGDV